MKELIQDSLILLQKEFELPSGSYDKEGLIDLLIPEVGRLLNKNFERFLQMCYRIDLGEEKLKDILRNSAPEQMNRILAEAILDRQLLKIEMRRKFQ